MDRTETLTNRERAEIALGAAVGAGCHRCVENLYPTLVSLGATADELERLFAIGLDARRSATDAIRRTATALLGRDLGSDRAPEQRRDDRVEDLTRLAAAAGANCACDALHQADRARSAGSPAAHIDVALGIARSVRARAQRFSDEEIGKSWGRDPAAEEPSSCCGSTSGSLAGPATCD
jgi:hypothetical protein